ncbi:MAG: HAD family phosphatase [Candidatus Tectomicrobia bacterium]|nr:HAD family phosphatase [Candidatus Tectomicrobia bacterium]
MANLRLVFFDLGNVVCRFLPARRLTAFAAATRLGAEEIQSTLWGSGFSERCDAGRYSGAEMYVQICQRLGVSLPRREVRRLWALAFEPSAEVVAIAAALRRQLPTGLLTNNPPLLREAFPEFLPDIERHFAPIIFSYQHWACKPSPALYEAVVRRTGIAAHATLLIDDAQTNVRGAAAAGWQAIHFTTPGALREALRDLGVSGMGA